MPSNFARIVMTGIIWFSILFLGGIMAQRVNGGDAVFMTLALALIGAWATRGVWAAGQAIVQQQAQPDEKSKRSRMRVGRLVESLSEDELDELRARLVEPDDIPVPLESLLPRRMGRD